MPRAAVRPGEACDEEARLVARIAAGEDGEPIAKLYDAYAKRLYALGRSLLGDPGMAEEMVQESFVRLWRSAGRYDPGRGSVRTFIYVIARRAAVDLMRRRAARPLASLEPLGEGGALEAAVGSDETYERLTLSLDLQAALETLTPDHSEVIRLAYMGDLSQQQIASRLGLPLGTVKSRTYHALRALREHLEEVEAIA